MHCYQNTTSFDWVALLALLVAIISVGIAVYYSRRTLVLTEAHNKKTVEPVFTTMYGKIGHIDHPRSFLRDHAFPAAKDHPKLTSFFASFSS